MTFLAKTFSSDDTLSVITPWSSPLWLASDIVLHAMRYLHCVLWLFYYHQRFSLWVVWIFISYAIIVCFVQFNFLRNRLLLFLDCCRGRVYTRWSLPMVEYTRLPVYTMEFIHGGVYRMESIHGVVYTRWSLDIVESASFTPYFFYSLCLPLLVSSTSYISHFLYLSLCIYPTLYISYSLYLPIPIFSTSYISCFLYVFCFLCFSFPLFFTRCFLFPMFFTPCVSHFFYLLFLYTYLSLFVSSISFVSQFFLSPIPCIFHPQYF